MAEANGASIKRLADPSGWAIVLTDRAPRRLIVFVHGFRGKAVGSWMDFAHSHRISHWWRESDLLFAGYDSVRDTITGVAARLRRELPRFYPAPPPSALEAGGVRVRPDAAPYQELLVIGHSLGGVIVRRAMADVAQDWVDRREVDPQAPRPALLNAELRLFSPASAGFQAAGPLGVLRASPGWWGINMYLRQSSAYSDLQPGSSVLAAIRDRTEALVTSDAATFQSLRARIVWANPEDVVISERYDSDFVEEVVDDVDHRNVCKPNTSYPIPWVFVELGRCQ
jgi:hypothetical protein